MSDETSQDETSSGTKRPGTKHPRYETEMVRNNQHHHTVVDCHHTEFIVYLILMYNIYIHVHTYRNI